MASNERSEPSYRILVALCGLLTAVTGGSLTIAANLAFSRLGAVEEEISEGILPRAEERIRILEREVSTLRSQMNQHLQDDH